jgi:ribonuclease BN (tRNA processing enzyme)
MIITVAGSGCGIPSAERGSPCIIVDIGKECIAFDCGPGSLREMAKAGVDPARLDAIFITHFHADHIADIAPLLFSLNIPDVNRVEPLTIYGPPGLKKLYDNLVGAYGDWLIPKRYELTLSELFGAPVEEENWRVETAPAEHSKPSYAYRLESNGRSMVYSGDTEYAEPVISLASGCDLLILECSYPDEIEVPGHLTPSKAGEMASRAGCRKLVLTHMYPVCADYDLVSECRKKYSGEIILAEDGMRVDLG